MTTSLARQLALLRTPAAVKSSLSSSSAVYSGPFIIPEAETEHNSVASLKGSVAESVSALCELEPDMMRFSVLLEMEEEETGARNLVKECLTMLCPHILNKHAQWLLQWLIIKHKVHINSPDWLVFNLLPYYSYKIYQSVLQHVDTSIHHASVDCVWLPQFKQSCVPTSQPGLHRHTATSQAFFRYLCEATLELGKQLSSYPNLKLHKHTTFLMSTLLGAMENIKNVSDQQVLLLLQVILTGLKSDNRDLAGLSTILLGYILPKVSLKPKVVQKICKSLGKYSKTRQSDATLNLVLLIFRTQEADPDTILELVVNHQASINEVIIKAETPDRDNDTVDQIDALIYSLASVLESCLPAEGTYKVGFSQSEQQLVDIVASVVTVSGEVQAETAEYLISVIADLLKQIDDEKTEDTLKTIKKLNNVLESLGTNFPEIYRRIMVEKRDSSEDIFFLPSVDSPSEVQLKAAKVLSSNQLVSALTNNVLIDITPGKGAKKIVKTNMSPLMTILSCSTKFLQTQLAAPKLEILLINLLRVADSQEAGELTELVLKHLCSKEMMEISTMQPVTELMLVSVMLSSPASRSFILSSEFCKSSSLLSLISSVSPTNEDFTSSLLEKLSVLIQPVHINTILNTKCLLHNTVLATALLDISPKLVEKSGTEMTQLICAVIGNLRSEKLNTDQGVFEEARKMNIVPWHTLLKAVKGLVGGKASLDNLESVFSSLAVLIEKGVPENCLELADIVINNPHTQPLQFLLKQAQCEDPKVACLSLSLAANYCKENVEQVRSSLKSKADSTVLYLLSALMSDNSKVQKAAMKVLTKLDFSSSGQMKAVLQFFLDHKEEINNNVENIEKVLEREFLDAKSCREILSRTTASENIDVFVKISPLFRRLSTSAELETLYKFGAICVEKAGDPRYCLAAIDIITKFVPLHVKSFEQSAMLDFFTASISSKIVTTVAGLRKNIPQILLSALTQDDTVSQLPVKLHAYFMSQLSNNSTADFYVEAKNFICGLLPSPETFVGELNDIWGADTFSGKRTSGRGKFSLLYGGEANAEDAVRWSRTNWILEVLEKMLSQSDSVESSKDWLLMLRPLFVLLRKVSLMELEETSYKMTLLLNVMKNLLARISDQELQKIDQSQVDPELLVHCIKSSPNPDTRQTALQVLARCVIFNPDFILQNSITIFTFMGSHLLRVDSRNSFQVACQSLDVLVPAIKAACEQQSGKAAKLQSACMGVLTTFIDACLDIPAHRLTQFLERLVKCLGEREYLWAAALLLVKKDKANGEKKVVELFTKMEPENGLEALIRLLVNTRGDSPQLRKMFGVKTDRKDDESAKEKPDDWDLLRLRAVQLVNSVLSCSRFKTSVTSALGNEEMEQLVNLLLEASILTLNTFTGLEVIMPSKFRKNLLLQTEKSLEQSLSVLPASGFISQCAVLLESKEDSVRHRALEVVSAKLSSTSTPLPAPQLSSLVAPLVQLSLSETQPHTQQLALLAVRQLSKLLQDPDSLQLASDSFTTTYLATLTNAKVLGAAVLSLGDILTCLGPKVVSKVPGLVSWLTERLEQPTFGQEQGWNDKEIAVVFNSFLYCLQKLVESFIGFLNPLLARLIIMACKMTGDDSLSLGRAKPLLTCLANTIPPHSVLAFSSQLLDNVMADSATESALPGLVTFVADNCRRLERSQLSSVSKQFVEFYTKALGYRASEEADEDQVDVIEDAVISAFLSVALKLSLEDFTPVYLKLANSMMDGDDEQHVTLFNFTDRVASKLKSLFSFGVETCVDFVIAALKKERSEEVVTACLKSLTTVLKFNKLENISSGKFENLVSALLRSWILESSEIVSCLVQLAISTPEDSNWKHLHFQILLQLRDERPEVRLSILSVLTQCVTDRTDTYLPVLPDAVPFIQEILEDDDNTVEAACRDFIQHMETVFGQSLESYFV